MKEKSVAELKAMIDSKVDFQLIDVREPHEYEIANINGTLIPMGDIAEHIADIAKGKPVVIHCRSGKRSATIIQFLESNYQFDNLYNLDGGILAWADEIDSSMAKY
jgi:adenylyltransferase/sulfurtransferase